MDVFIANGYQSWAGRQLALCNYASKQIFLALDKVLNMVEFGKR